MNKTAMEVMQLLEMCRKNDTTVKKAFSRLGLRDMQEGRRPFKELSEKDLFAYLMNWIINQMQGDEKALMRYRVGKETYQMEFYYACRQLRLRKPVIISTDENFVLYEWTNEDNYNETTEHTIAESIRRADAKNLRLQNMAIEFNETGPNLSVETQHNMTDDESELIESFLET